MNRLMVRLLITLIFVLYSHLCFANIWIKSKEVDLGKILQGKPIEYTFVIKNTGTKPVKIKKVSPS